MSEERERRVGHNEALFRQVNETIEQMNKAIDHVTDDFTIVCECGTLSCAERIHVAPAVYEQARASSVQFLVKPGHEMTDVERVLDTRGSYVLVEKDATGARAAARETDPRTS